MNYLSFLPFVVFCILTLAAVGSSGRMRRRFTTLALAAIVVMMAQLAVRTGQFLTQGKTLEAKMVKTTSYAEAESLVEASYERRIVRLRKHANTVQEFLEHKALIDADTDQLLELAAQLHAEELAFGQ